MYVFLSGILAAVGLIMAAKPKLFFDITEGWKSNAEREPSDLYRISTRLGGILFLLVGVAGMIVLGVLGW